MAQTEAGDPQARRALRDRNSQWKIAYVGNGHPDWRWLHLSGGSMAREILRDRFIATLGDLGGSAGNGRLRDALGWQEETYRNVHAELVEEGVITVGRGRGGSVSLSTMGEKKPEVQSALPIPPPQPSAPVPKRTEKPERNEKNVNGANLGFEAQMFLAADKLRKNLEPSDYKHVALGLIFLK